MQMLMSAYAYIWMSAYLHHTCHRCLICDLLSPISREERGRQRPPFTWPLVSGGTGERCLLTLTPRVLRPNGRCSWKTSDRSIFSPIPGRIFTDGSPSSAKGTPTSSSIRHLATMPLCEAPSSAPRRHTAHFAARIHSTSDVRLSRRRSAVAASGRRACR